MFGVGLTFGNWISLIVCVMITLLALIFRIRIEEQALRGHFGAVYDDYAKRSWALIPGVW
jgi:protein-S-isoprenylcysteine O-methyltransferase Ste14